MKRILIFCLFAALLASCSSSRINHIVAFGDDLSDTGNCYKLFKEAVDNGEYNLGDIKFFTQSWENRLSNGPVAIEVLADRLKTGLTSYAVCAATTGQDNLNVGVSSLKNTGVLGQLDKYESDLNGKKADSGSLYFIEASQDDFATSFYAGRLTNDKVIRDVADQAISNISTAISRLTNLGARQFLVANSADLSILPGVISDGGDTQSKVFQTYFNSTLPGKMESLAKQLNIQIKVFDFIATSDRIRANPGQYGLTNIIEPCTQAPNYSESVCTKPDAYYFWGYYYTTRRVNQLMGEAMAEYMNK